MAGLGTDATTLIITGGFSSTPVMVGIVTNFVSLYYVPASFPTHTKKGDRGGGAGVPRPWRKHEEVEELPELKNVVVLKIKFKGNTVEKSYVIPSKFHIQTLRVFGLVNATHQKINITIGQLKRLTNNIKIKIHNIIVKNNK